MDPETITITKVEYEQLLESNRVLKELRYVIDNWSDYQLYLETPNDKGINNEI